MYRRKLFNWKSKENSLRLASYCETEQVSRQAENDLLKCNKSVGKKKLKPLINQFFGAVRGVERLRMFLVLEKNENKSLHWWKKKKKNLKTNQTRQSSWDRSAIITNGGNLIVFLFPHLHHEKLQYDSFSMRWDLMLLTFLQQHYLWTWGAQNICYMIA